MPPAPSPRLFLVDGYALIYRAFFALGTQPLINSRGENTSIARGAHEFLKKLTEKHKPEYLGWVHDAGLSFRHERYAEYKATRERLEPSLQADFDTGVERISRILDAYRIPILSLDGYEADDVIGTLAKKATAAGVNAVIVSGDKDFMQLVGTGIWVLNPWHGRPGFTSEKWFDSENASERLGVPPERVVDYLALLGDTSDNIPGVKGIGDKTAHELITRWGSLENMLAHLEEVEPARARNALRQFGENGRMSKDLLTILEDLPVPLDLAALSLKEPDWPRLRSLFVELEFRADAQDAAVHAGEGGGPVDGAIAGPKVDREYQIVDNVEGLQRLVQVARESELIAIDIETMPDEDAPPVATPLRTTLVGISIAVAPGQAYYLPLAHRAPESSQGDLSLGTIKEARKTGTSIASRMLAEGPHAIRNLPPLQADAMSPLWSLLADATVKKSVHNMKYAVLVLRRAQLAIAGISFDPMLASYLLDPGRRSHALDALAVEFLHVPITSLEELTGKGKLQVPFGEVPIAAARDYSCVAADVTLRLTHLLQAKLQDIDASELLRRVELPLVDVLAEMEWHGIAIDVPWFHSLKARSARERAEVERRVYETAGEQFNINSNKQLASILFGKLALPVRKRTTTGPSTDASVLQDLAEEGHVLPSLLMEYRELSKLENTYLDTLPALVNPKTGRL